MVPGWLVSATASLLALTTAWRAARQALVGRMKQVTGVTGRPATDAEQTVAALAQREQDLRIITHSVQDGILSVDAGGRILFANPAAAAIFGYPLEELIGLPIIALIPEHLRAAHLDGFARYLRTGERWIDWSGTEYRGRRRDGQELVLEIAFGEYRAGDRHIFTGVVRDVTARKHAEEARRQAEAAARAAAERAQALAHTAQRLNARLDLPTVLRAVVEETARALRAPAASIALYDEAADRIAIAATHGLPEDYAARAAPQPRAVLDRLVGAGGQDLLLVPETLGRQDLPNTALHREADVRTIAGVPLRREGRLVGLLTVYGLGAPRHFDPAELDLLRALGDLAVQAITNATLYAEHLQELETLSALYASAQKLGISLDLQEVARSITRTCVDVFGARLAWIGRAEPDGRVTPVTSYPASSDYPLRVQIRWDEAPEGQGPTGRALRTGYPQVCNDVARESPERPWRDRVLAQGFRAAAAFPLLSRERSFGVLLLYSDQAGFFTDQRVGLFQALAHQASAALENARLFEALQRSHRDLQEAYEATLEGWVQALDLRDEETHGHTQRVTEMTVRLARAMGIEGPQLVHIRRGALLHDIGKIGIPDAILRKPGPLTEEEWAVVRRHPVHAHQLLFPIAYLRPALDIPYAHHERWDGSGYPQGLRGEAIPLAARIFAVVDVWDALCSDRPYRPAWPEDRVIAYLREQSGKAFDPRVVEAFLHLLEQPTTPSRPGAGAGGRSTGGRGGGQRPRRHPPTRAAGQR